MDLTPIYLLVFLIILPFYLPGRCPQQECLYYQSREVADTVVLIKSKKKWTSIITVTLTEGLKVSIPEARTWAPALLITKLSTGVSNWTLMLLAMYVSMIPGMT